MADHGQIPMFSDDDLGHTGQTFKALLQIVREQAQALHEATVINRELLQNARDAWHQSNGVASSAPAAEPAAEKPVHLPQNKELRTWDGFVAYFQRLERIVRREQQLPAERIVAREMIYAAGGPSPKTITRIMVETYGLKPEQWPPSTWPKEPPGGPADKF